LPKPDHIYKVLNRKIAQAIHAYEMIADGDRIAVGLSGGKDSWALFYLLCERQKRVPVNYHVQGVHIDLGFGGKSAHSIREHADQMGIAVHLEQTDIGPVAHSEINRENPCFLCSRRRRQRLFEIAEQYGCNKIALGHSKDDLIETLFLNMFYAGEMSTMMPSQPFFNGRFVIIRPLAFTDEKHLSDFAKQMQWPVEPNPCPSAGNSKRAEVKKLLQDLFRTNRKIKGNIFRAMRHINIDYLLKQ
jgi:tRNA 2-thiocytidine biosynthesis protein TtcA